MNIWEEYESKIFKDESKLLPDYVPPYLPFREGQLRMLVQIFRGIIERPGEAFYRAIAYGPVGVGKTAVSKVFGKSLVERGRTKGVRVHYIHVNCYRERTSYMVAKRIASYLIKHTPSRGFSAQEYLDIAWSALEDTDAYAFIVIDELDYLIRFNPEALYMLTRISDTYLNVKNRMNMLFIARDISLLRMLDESIISTLMRNLIRFDPYTSKQLEKILFDRVDIAFKPGVVGEEVISYVADLAGIDKGGNGDARYALELLWRAGKWAELLNSDKVLPEHVRRANADVHPYIRAEDLENLSTHELYLLLAISELLSKNVEPYVSFGEVEKKYRILCEERGIRFRKHTQLWEYLQNLKNLGFIITKVSNRRRGRTTLIGLPGISAELLEKKIRELLGEGGINDIRRFVRFKD